MENGKNTGVALGLKNVVKVYGEGDTAVQALKGINLYFRKSEFVCVLGPSGCGKTTLLNIIGGLDRYTSGDLLINGVSTKEYGDRDWDTYRNNSIGFVFQSYNLIPHQTIQSNVELALTLSGIGKEERVRRAQNALEQVGLGGLGYKKPNQLSGGQMQRVAIARALVNDPDVILADEPTGALDTETSVQVMDLLKSVSKDRLVIMVTHNPELAQKYSTRIITLLDGEKTGDTDPYVPATAEDGTDTEIHAKAEETPEKSEETEPVKEKKEKNKSAMRLKTAFSLSFANLLAKKARTVLTSVAGSIGIIGIALVLAVSTGFSGYITELQADTLSSYPLTVSESMIDLSDFEKLASSISEEDVVGQRLTEKVYSKALFGDLTNMLKSNKLTQDYIDYVSEYADRKNEEAKNTPEKWAYCVKLGYGMDINDYIFTDIGYNAQKTGSAKHSVMSINTFVQFMESLFNEGLSQSNMNISAEFVRSYIPTVCEIPDNDDLIRAQYDLLCGEFATKEDELLLVVDKYNRIDDITLAVLGFRTIDGLDGYNVTFGGDEEMDFDRVMSKEFWYINNSERFVKGYPYSEVFGDNYVSKIYAAKPSDVTLSNPAVPSSAKKLKITGIVRLKDDVQQGVLKKGIAYTSAFVQSILDDEGNKNAQILAATDTGIDNGDNERIYQSVPVINLLANAKNYYAVMAHLADPENVPDPEVQWQYNYYSRRALGGDQTVSKISVYSRDFDAKEKIKSYLDEWNTDKQEEDQIHYSDSTAMLFSAMNMIVEGVEIVLIAFTAISLVVSSIMIGIITYVSVVERTKEIGVLRSLGARKKDISRIFNAETFLIGLFAGLIGVTVSYLLTIPINLIIGGLLSGGGNIAALRVTDAVILVIISFILTLVAGVIPARIAAKKDPVVALRSE